jgi:TonB family protein
MLSVRTYFGLQCRTTMTRHGQAREVPKKRKGWSAWNRAEVLAVLTLVAATLVIPEVRYFLHLEKRPAEKAAPSDTTKSSDNPPVTETPTVEPPAKEPQREKRHELKVEPLPTATPPAEPTQQFVDNSRKPNHGVTVMGHSNTVRGLTGQHHLTAEEVMALSTKPVEVDPKTAGELLEKSVKPVYPPLARQARIAGSVILKLRVDKDGSVDDVTIISGHPMLVPSAIDAVNQWVYKPYIENGKVVPFFTTVEVKFESDSPQN